MTRNWLCSYRIEFPGPAMRVVGSKLVSARGVPSAALALTAFIKQNYPTALSYTTTIETDPDATDIPDDQWQCVLMTVLLRVLVVEE